MRQLIDQARAFRHCPVSTFRDAVSCALLLVQLCDVELSSHEEAPHQAPIPPPTSNPQLQIVAPSSAACSFLFSRFLVCSVPLPRKWMLTFPGTDSTLLNSATIIPINGFVVHLAPSEAPCLTPSLGQITSPLRRGYSTRHEYEQLQMAMAVVTSGLCDGYSCPYTFPAHVAQALKPCPHQTLPCPFFSPTQPLQPQPKPQPIVFACSTIQHHVFRNAPVARHWLPGWLSVTGAA